jgi:hypothetical protein
MSGSEGSLRAHARSALVALAFLVGLAGGVAEADPPDFCVKIGDSFRERGCCVEESRNCESLRASYEKRGCTEDLCYIGCGAMVCQKWLDQRCCNASCSLCAAGDQTCTADICE